MISLAIEDLINDPGVLNFENVTLTAGPALSASMYPSSNVSMYVGQSQTFTENTSGGTAPSYFQWFLNDSNLVYTQPYAANSSSWTFTPTNPGTYEIACVVIDQADCDFAYNASQIFKTSITFVTVNAPVPRASYPPQQVWVLRYLKLEGSNLWWWFVWNC
jgi:hypothetical protein